MKLGVWRERETEPSILLDLAESENGDPAISVVNEDGLMKPNHLIGWFTGDGLHLSKYLDPDLGFPLDKQGRIKIVK